MDVGVAYSTAVDTTKRSRKADTTKGAAAWGRTSYHTCKPPPRSNVIVHLVQRVEPSPEASFITTASFRPATKPPSSKTCPASATSPRASTANPTCGPIQLKRPHNQQDRHAERGACGVNQRTTQSGKTTNSRLSSSAWWYSSSAKYAPSYTHLVIVTALSYFKRSAGGEMK